MDITVACRDINELTENAQTACKLFLKTCSDLGLSIFITETYRSKDRQTYLYSLGRTRKGNKVTWTLNSRHISRHAWDIACKGKNLYDAEILKKCGDVAKQLGITWGGIWKTPDTPHFEIDENWSYIESEEINMEELNSLRADYEAYKNHANNIIQTMGEEIQSLKDIINLMGQEIEQLKKR